jgi:hypothetical protein
MTIATKDAQKRFGCVSSTGVDASSTLPET